MEMSKVDAEDLIPLKKALFNFWKHYHEDYFFLIGCVVGRKSYRQICELATQYKLNTASLDWFSALVLRKNFRTLNLDEHCADAEIKKALAYLKTSTAQILYYPAIFRLDPKLKKYFAALPSKLPYLAELLFHYKSTEGLNCRKGLPEEFILKYVKRAFNMSQEFFQESALEIFGVETYVADGKRYLSLDDLAQWEEIVIEEAGSPSSVSDFIAALKENGIDIDNKPQHVKDFFNALLNDELDRALSNLAKEMKN